MKSNDLLFWYTGSVVWTIISILVAVSVFWILLYSLYRFYVASLWYKGFYKLVNIPEQYSDEWFKVRYAFKKALDDMKVYLTEEEEMTLFESIYTNYNNYTTNSDGYRTFTLWGNSSNGLSLTEFSKQLHNKQ